MDDVAIDDYTNHTLEIGIINYVNSISISIFVQKLCMLSHLPVYWRLTINKINS